MMCAILCVPPQGRGRNSRWGAVKPLLSVLDEEDDEYVLREAIVALGHTGLDEQGHCPPKPAPIWWAVLLGCTKLTPNV